MNTRSKLNRVLRNPYRVLNHLDLIASKTEIGTRWGLIRQNVAGETAPLAALSSLCVSKMGTEEVLCAIAAANNRRVEDLIADMEAVYATGQVELHITDLCDLDCVDCHYPRKSAATIAFDQLSQMLANLRPRAVTVTGGGEPNCYASGGKTLNDVILLIHDTLPDAQIGLINNNTRMPSGLWTHHLAWQRTSVDAASAETYRRIKRVDRYEQVAANVERMLLETPVAHVGVGFLYRAENAREIGEFLDGWYDRCRRLPPAAQSRLNIQFRPISPPIHRMEDIRAGAEYLPANVVSAVRTQVREVAQRAQHDADFAEFLATATNFESVASAASERDPFVHRPYAFTRCYNSLIHRVVRANGDEYPDFLLCDFPEHALGNTLHGTLERVRIGLAQFQYHNCGTRFCNPGSCRQSWVSGIIERPDQERAAGRPLDNYFF